jgi:hypothetical protein
LRDLSQGGSFTADDFAATAEPEPAAPSPHPLDLGVFQPPDLGDDCDGAGPLATRELQRQNDLAFYERVIEPRPAAAVHGAVGGFRRRSLRRGV